MVDSGASGKTRNLKGAGVKSVVNVGTGLYMVTFDDEYYRYLGGFAGCVEPLSGTSVSAGSFSVGTAYVITSIGTTNYNLIGVPSGSTPAVGMAFVATGAGAGNGTAQATAAPGVAVIDVVGDPNLSISQSGAPYMIIACRNFSDALANPADGTVIGLDFMLRNSSVKGKGETETY